MPSQDPTPKIREAVGIFGNPKDLQDAVDELLTSGFDHADLSLLAGEDTVQEKLGHRYDRVSELEDDATVPRTVYVPNETVGDMEGGIISSLFYIGAVAAAGAVVATGGTAAAAIAMAALAGGTGGLVGSALAKVIDERHARHLQEQIDHGGLLLWVRTRDKEHEDRAQEILGRHSGKDVHIHTLPAPQFDDDGRPILPSGT